MFHTVPASGLMSDDFQVDCCVDTMERLKSKWVYSKKTAANINQQTYLFEDFDAPDWDDHIVDPLKEKASWMSANAGNDSQWSAAQSNDAVTPSMPQGGRGAETLKCLINDGRQQQGGDLEISSWFQCGDGDDFLLDAVGTTHGQAEDTRGGRRESGGFGSSGAGNRRDGGNPKAYDVDYGGNCEPTNGQPSLVDLSAPESAAVSMGGGRPAAYGQLPCAVDRMEGSVTHSRPGRTSTAADALALGAKRAAGLVPPQGGDVFNKVHTNTRATITTTSSPPPTAAAPQPPWSVEPICRPAPPARTPVRGPLPGNLLAQPAANVTDSLAPEPLQRAQGLADGRGPSSLAAPPGSQPINFPLFALPAQRQKFQTVVQQTGPGQVPAGAARGGMGIHGQQRTTSLAGSFAESLLPAAGTAPSSQPSTLPENFPLASTSAGLDSPPPYLSPRLLALPNSFALQTQRSSSLPSRGMGRVSNFGLLPRRQASLAAGGPAGVLMRAAMPPPPPPAAAAGSAQASPSANSCRPGSLATGSAGGGQQSLLAHRLSGRSETLEPTVTCSGDSAHSEGGFEDGCPKHKSVSPPVSSGPRRLKREREDDTVNTDADRVEPEDVVDDSGGMKKGGGKAGGPTKRSRAAEVHNQSERRRRDRINEKMRALQELIPNSNKTDKASMLDEAIEYLKMLQMQLQVMSTRTQMMGPVLPNPSMGMGMGPMPQHMPPHMLPPPASGVMGGGLMGMGATLGGGLGLGGGAMSMGMPPNHDLGAQQAAAQQFLMSLDCQQAAQSRLGQGAFGAPQGPQSLGRGVGVGLSNPMGHQLPHVSPSSSQLTHVANSLGMMPGLMDPAYRQQVESIGAVLAQQRQQSLSSSSNQLSLDASSVSQAYQILQQQQQQAHMGMLPR